MDSIRKRTEAWVEFLLRPGLAGMLILLCVGVFLRLDQFGSQILLDDEWHAVHQLLSGKTPAELFYTIGFADYSIPLGLLYWIESQWFGLSELAMRWPMLMAGIVTLVLFAWFAWRLISPLGALVFAFLLATSPVLIIYGHTARPYALTLLFSYFGLFAFYQYWSDPGSRLKWGGLYCGAASFSMWLHPITAPLLAAPFLLQAAKSLARGAWKDYITLAALALPTAVLAGLLVIPPLYSDLTAFSHKVGTGSLGIDTLVGMLYMWFGTGSDICLVILVGLAIVGIRRVLVSSEMLQSVLLGILLTIAVVLLMRPAWISHSITVGRYLLAALPLLLLASAMGVQILVCRIGRLGNRARWGGVSLAVLLLLYYLVQSPIWTLVQEPNSNRNHIRFQFDFRPADNAVTIYERKIPFSPFWTSLRNSTAKAGWVAVAPFYFETYNWDGPRWEQAGGVRVVPAYLIDYCVAKRFGEVPASKRFRFKNVFYLSSMGDPGTDHPDWLVYTKPFRGHKDGKDNQVIGGDISHCLDSLRADLGTPDYEDSALVAYDLKTLGVRERQSGAAGTTRSGKPDAFQP